MNENILNYIRQYRNIYTREAITGELVRAGYQPSEIEAAWQSIEATPQASPPPPWSGDLSQQPPGAVPGQQPPPDPFYGQASSAEQQTFSGWQPPLSGQQPPFESQSQANPPPPFETQQPYGAQPPPGWQPPPPGTGPYYGPQVYPNVDPNGRPNPTYFIGQRSRQSQHFWSSFVTSAVLVIFGTLYVSTVANSFIPTVLIVLGLVIASIIFWNRNRQVARGLLFGIFGAVFGSAILGFVLVVIILGICTITGTRF